MKKTIALLLCLCMLACLFVGCASTSTTEKPTSETTTTETAASGTSASGNKVLKIGIFGSVARGEQTEKSDLEKRCGCPIDLIRLRKSLRPLLLDKILKEGIYA
mgnify:CR=1 FL=1